MIWKLKRYTKRMEAPQVNPTKVQQKVDELNNESKIGQWIPSDGLSAMTGFKYGFSDNDSQFLVGSGIPVKIFFNNKTGEVKIFLAVLFRD